MRFTATQHDQPDELLVAQVGICGRNFVRFTHPKHECGVICCRHRLMHTELITVNIDCMHASDTT